MQFERAPTQPLEGVPFLAEVSHPSSSFATYVRLKTGMALLCFTNNLKIKYFP